MKKYALILLLALLGTIVPAAAAAAEAPTARLIVDGIELIADVPPTIMNNRTLVPFRAIAEALGVSVTWHAESRSILASGQGKSLQLVLDQTTALVNGASRQMDVAPQLVRNRTMVPARLFAEAFGATVTWDAPTRTAYVRSAVRPMETLAFYGLGSYEWRHYIPRFAGVAYTWSMLDQSGQLTLTEVPYYWPEGADEVLTLAQESLTDRYLTVIAGDADDRVTNLVLDPAARERLAGQIEAVLTEQGLEGVVIDLEGLGLELEGTALERVREGYVALLESVSARLKPLRKQVIAAVHPPNGWYPGYDYTAIATSVDRVLIMAHDYNPAESTDPEPLDQVEEAVRMSVALIPPEKLLLGILMEHENRESVIQKVSLAKRYNLAGISIWILRSLDQEEMEAIETLVSPAR